MPLKSSSIFILLLIIVTSAGRFLFLENSPPGFFSDESIGATNVICMRQTGHDGYGTFSPLFAHADRSAGGYTTPVYLYGGVIWSVIFGDSITSFRAFSACITSLTFLGLFFLVKFHTGSSVAWLTVLAASVSPWAWQFSRIAWDPPLMPLFTVWGSYFFLRSEKYYDAALAGILLSIAMYSYPPGRILIPLLVPAFYIIKRWNTGFMLIFAAAFIPTSLPLILFLMSPESMARFGMVGIANKGYLQRFGDPDIFTFAQILAKNIWKHLSPDFLFFAGDNNLRHSTRKTGQLGWLDICGLLALIAFAIKTKGKSLNNRFLWFSVTGFLCAVLPAALTWEAIPHSLRSIGAWPFVACLAGIGLGQITRCWHNGTYGICFLACLYITIFGYDYFIHYPVRSYAWFDGNIKQLAINAQKSGDWSIFENKTQRYFNLGRRYYQIVYGQKSCKEFIN